MKQLITDWLIALIITDCVCTNEKKAVIARILILQLTVFPRIVTDFS